MSAPAPTAAGASRVDVAAAASVPNRALDSGAAAAEERRVQPRLGRGPDGQSPPALLDDNSAAALAQPLADSHADAHAQPPPPADRLYRHALESIFAFLGLRQLAIALRVSRGWLSAAKSMRRLELTVGQLDEDQRVDEVAESTMGRHVVGLEYARLGAATLAVLAARMAHLRDLSCSLGLPPADQPMIFPANLRLLGVFFEDPTDIQIHSAIAAISRLPLLEELTVRLPALDPHLSFAPLAALPLLRRLDVWWQSRATDLSDAQIDELRQMPRLREVDVPLTRPLLGRLLRQPHDLQWHNCRLPFPVSDEVAALLPQLPSLTAIDCHVTCDRFDWLRGLPNLTDVSLRLYSGAEGRAASMAAALQCCARIEILGLICRDLTTALLTDLLPRLPKLRQLLLDDLRVDSLSFLAQPPLTAQLSRLELSDCTRLPPGELGHVLALRGLTQLTVHESFIALLDAEIRSLLTPPSVLLPRLEKFEYQAR